MSDTAQQYFQTIQSPSVAEYKDRGSKFLAYAYPISSVEDFKEKLQLLKAEHPKAVHHCFAYRLGIDGNNFRASDDGEPSGSAGRPILGQIDSKALTDVLVVVVRYFGGTLLGVPGLINAYKTATSLALQLTPTMRKMVMTSTSITFDYTQMNDVMRWLKHFEAEIVAQDMQLFCTIECRLPAAKITEAAQIFQSLRGVEFKLRN